MDKFFEFRDLERDLNNKSEFLFRIKTMLGKGSDLKSQEVAKIIKASGLLINPYPGKHKYEKLVKEVEDVIYNSKEYDLIKEWDRYKFQAELFNEFYKLCYNNDEYMKTENLQREIEIQSFLVSLEIILTSFSKRPYPLSLKINIQHAFIKHNSAAMASMRMFNYISNISGGIISYLLFHKKGEMDGLDKELILDESTLLMSFAHFTSYDKTNIFKDIVDNWKYHDYIIKVSNGEVLIEPKNKTIYLSDEISLARFETRREKLNIEIQHTNDDDSKINVDSRVLPPIEFLNKDEVIAYHSCMEYFFLNNLDQKVKGVSFKKWIRSFTVMKKICIDFLENRKVTATNISLSNICLTISNNLLIENFIKYGIDLESAIIIIKVLTFKKGATDIFDQPLIPINTSEFILVPSLVASIDTTRVLMCSLLKNDSNMDFKGYGFENRIINELREQNIVCGSLNSVGYSEEGIERPYQCDVAFVLGKDLYLCECKSFAQPTTHRGFYELLEKKEQAVNPQLKAISDYYIKNIDLVKQQLKLANTWLPEKVYNLLITTTPVGASEKIENTYIIDYSALSSFIQRDKPGVISLSEKRKYELGKFPNYNGEITSDKLIKFLKKPTPVVLEKARRRRMYKILDFGQYQIKIFDFETRFDDKISMNDEHIKKYINKLDNTYLSILH